MEARVSNHHVFVTFDVCLVVYVHIYVCICVFFQGSEVKLRELLWKHLSRPHPLSFLTRTSQSLTCHRLLEGLRKKRVSFCFLSFRFRDALYLVILFSFFSS